MRREVLIVLGMLAWHALLCVGAVVLCLNPTGALGSQTAGETH